MPTGIADYGGALGRDEMNLAEFPLAALANRVANGQKTLVFEDAVWDKRAGQEVTRRLTISASDRYGLPTALDDEVVLGLVQLTRQARFTAPRINFSKYELIQILGWRLEGKSYQRIDESLKRWLGVTLYYEKAWWNKQAKCWIDAGFHLIEQISLARKQAAKSGQIAIAEPATSSFTWNAIVFQSFQAGYIKQLDMDLYRQLKGSIAKRMFRFLDKRFYHRANWDFPLVEFACEHIGVSRNYDAAQLKRCLLPAINELEQAGFLRPMTADVRFVRVSRGNWRVSFAKALQRSQAEKTVSGSNSLESQLVARGVRERAAAQIVASNPAVVIEARLQVFDALLASGDARVSRNPAGYLVASIRENYTAPCSLPKPPLLSRRRRSESKTCAPIAVSPVNNVNEARAADYLDKLCERELVELTRDAERLAPPLYREGLRRAIDTGNVGLEKTYRAGMLRARILEILAR